jgi:cobalt/nickel-transporting P-type ATPase D
MPLTTLEMPAQEVSQQLYQCKSSARPSSWRAALWSVVWVRWAAVALGLFLAGVTAELNGAPETVWWTLYLACYLTGGWGSAWAGVQALRNKAVDVDLLISSRRSERSRSARSSTEPC